MNTLDKIDFVKMVVKKINDNVFVEKNDAKTAYDYYREIAYNNQIKLTGYKKIEWIRIGQIIGEYIDP